MMRAWVFASLAALCSVAIAADPQPVVTYSKQAKFENVRDDMKLAIEARGLVIDYHSFINRMLERTGQDVGSAKKLYADAQAFVFCSAVLSRKTMEADLANARCARTPWSCTQRHRIRRRSTFRIAALASGWSAASKAALKEVESLLDAVARESLGLK